MRHFQIQPILKVARPTVIVLLLRFSTGSEEAGVNEKILVMYYTNHALDQFLEDLSIMSISDEDVVHSESTNKWTTRTQCLAMKKGIIQRETTT